MFFGSNQLIVEPEVLRVQADNVENSMAKLRAIFEEIESTVMASQNYWIGDGQTGHVSGYQKVMPSVDIVFQRFTEQVNDLREMAGIYQNTEAVNTSEAEALPSDVIS